jgi:hypothetical protein
MRYKIIGFIFFIYALIFHASENRIHIVNLLITFLLIQYKKWQASERKKLAFYLPEKCKL